MGVSGHLVRIYLHFNWSTKDRVASIDAVAERIIAQVAMTKAGELGFYVIALKGTEDHPHLRNAWLNATSRMNSETVGR